MKGRGSFFFIAVFLLLFIPNQWMQFLARTLLFAGALSWIVGLIQRKSIQLTPEFPVLHAYAYEHVNIVLRIKNRGFTTIPVAGMRDANGGMHIHGSLSATFLLNPHTQYVHEYQVWQEHRGCYFLGPVRIEGIDPLGLFPWTLELAVKRKVIVFPRVIPLDLEQIAGVFGSSTTSIRPEHKDQLDIKGFRPYEQGDDTRDIHWKASAHLGNLIIKTLRLVQDIPVFLLLNLNKSDFDLHRQDAHIERCLEAATALTVYAASSNLPLGFATNGTVPQNVLVPYFSDQLSDNIQVPIGHLHENMTSILELFALLQPTTTNQSFGDWLSTINLHGQALVFLISPPLLSDDLKTLQRVRPFTRGLYWWVLDEQLERERRFGIPEVNLPEEINTIRLGEFSDELSFRRNK